MKRILVATKNPGKLREFKSFLSELPVEVVSLRDVGITEDVEENGKSYEENSRKKALFYAKKSGLVTISDDGGIEIEALNFEPGIRSRRWLGYEATDEELVKHMIKISKDLPDDNRTAYFRTIVSVATPHDRVFQQFGEVKGVIAKKPFLKLNKGYPYRSFFYLPEINKYYHESDLSQEEEKIYNHRYKAIQKLIPKINELLND